MTSTAEEYDVIVLGAGPTGENVADRTVAAGLRTVIVEAELVGGECSYWACMPSKALLRPVAALADARAVAGSREAVGDGRLDAAAVLARRDSFTSGWNDDGQVRWLRDTGIELVRGHGRLAGERTVTVEAEDGSERMLTARHAVVVCTGSRPVLPAHVPGLADAHRGPTGRRPARRPSRDGWRWSAAGWSGWRWPPPGGRSAPRWCCWCAATGCCPGWSRSRASWSPRACGTPGWTSGSAPRSPRWSGRTAPGRWP